MDRKKVIKWIEYDYLPRVGAYRKDCKQGCDACMPMHDGDDYCDIDMLWKILALLKEQEPVKVKDYADIVDGIQVGYCPKCDRKIFWNPEKDGTVAFCKYCGQAVKWE